MNVKMKEGLVDVFEREQQDYILLQNSYGFEFPNLTSLHFFTFFKISLVYIFTISLVYIFTILLVYKSSTTTNLRQTRNDVRQNELMEFQKGWLMFCKGVQHRRRMLRDCRVSALLKGANIHRRLVKM